MSPATNRLEVDSEDIVDIPSVPPPAYSPVRHNRPRLPEADRNPRLQECEHNERASRDTRMGDASISHITYPDMEMENKLHKLTLDQIARTTTLSSFRLSCARSARLSLAVSRSAGYVKLTFVFGCDAMFPCPHRGAHM
jgi:hypothetical protein